MTALGRDSNRQESFPPLDHLHGAATTVGRIRVVPICDACVPAPLEDDVTRPKEGWARFQELYPWAFIERDELYWNFHVHAFLLICPGDRLVLVDTGFGDYERFEIWNRWANLRPDKTSEEWLGRVPTEMRIAGFGPSDIDDVVISHLHLDHAGGVASGADDGLSLTFPNARCHLPQRDWEFWASHGGEDIESEIFERYWRGLEGESQVRISQSEIDVVEGVRLVNTPGHTRGHRSVLVTSLDETLLLACDVLHHPFQFAHPEYRGQDDLGEEGIKSRKRVLAEAEAGGCLLSATHFVLPFARARRTDGQLDAAFVAM